MAGVGCFVAGTLVVTGELPEDATTTADTGVPFAKLAGGLTTTFVCIGFVGAVILEAHRRRKARMEREERERLERQRLLSLEEDIVKDEHQQLENLLDSLSHHEQHFGEDGFGPPGDQSSLMFKGETSVALLDSEPREAAPAPQRRPRRNSLLAVSGSKPVSVRTRFKQLASLPLLWLGVFTVLGISCALWSLGRTTDGIASGSHQAVVNTPRFTYKRIEELQVGNWLLSDDPQTVGVDCVDFSKFSPESLQVLRVRMEKPGGGTLWLEMLSSPLTPQFQNAKPGDQLPLAYEELGILGVGLVLDAKPCRRIASRPTGRHCLVTTTFKHDSQAIIEITVDRTPIPLRGTANHPFWSVDRKEYVQAGQLRIGESLLTADGVTASVVTTSVTNEAEVVYNIEVQGEHAYYVGPSGILVHNAKNYRSDSLFRALRPDEWQSLMEWQRLQPKGISKDIEAHVQQLPTRYISASETLEGARRFQSSAPIIEISRKRLLETGSGVVDHKNVLQALRGEDRRNAERALEVLIKNGIAPQTIVRYHF